MKLSERTCVKISLTRSNSDGVDGRRRNYDLHRRTSLGFLALARCHTYYKNRTVEYASKSFALASINP